MVTVTECCQLTMDVDRFNFWQTLPTVLEAISLADYVAFDLEMSGIPNLVGASQPTESTFYHLAAEAARTFQILQVGLTCLSYDCKHKGPLSNGTALRSRWLTSKQNTEAEPLPSNSPLSSSHPTQHWRSSSTENWFFHTAAFCSLRKTTFLSNRPSHRVSHTLAVPKGHSPTVCT